MAELLQLLQAGDDIGGILLVGILWVQHRRLEKLEGKVFPS